MFFIRFAFVSCAVVLSLVFPAFGQTQLNLQALGTARQSSDASSSHYATNAVDGNPLTASQTLNMPNSFWEVELERTVQISSVEMVSPLNADNLKLRIYDLRDEVIFTANVTGTTPGGTWTTNLPSPVRGRIIRFGLEDGQTNGHGDFRIVLYEVRAFGDASAVYGPTNSPNYALNKESYWTRVSEAVAPATNANDGNLATVVSTPNSTHDPYWEVDLGESRALYSVRVAVASGFEGDMSRATVSVFNEAHDLVFSKHLDGSLAVHDVALPSPVIGRFVRVGNEYAERTRTPSGANWFIGMREVEVYGRPTNEVGVLSFSATSTQIVAGASVTLNWQEEDLYQLNLYPNIGSVGSNTTAGVGSRTVTPAGSTEYILVGSNYSGNFVRHLTINVNGTNLPPRITEFMAANSLTLRDGNKNFSDWIEIHNPNNTPLDLSGHYLSDNPAALTKWKFPSGVVMPPHGYLIVFASDASASQPYDSGGNLQTSFALSADGESVLLTASNGVTVLDAITNFPAQTADLAYGRTLNGELKFLEPTPGAANVATAYEGWLVPLQFSHSRGWYTNQFSLTLSNSNPGSQVFFSNDGGEPWIPYFSPLTIQNTVAIRANVVRADYKSPRTLTHTYLFLDGIINSSSIGAAYREATYTNRLRQGFLDLPVFSINVPPSDPKWSYLSNYNRERPEREASFEIFMPDGSKIQENCGLVQYGGYFGTGSGNPYAKKSWQVQFRSRYGARKLEFPLFHGFGHGVTPKSAFNEINIHAGNHDMSSRGFYMSHRFAADTMLDMGSLNPHGRFVHLFINGAYMGQFDAHERLTDAFLSEYLGGQREDYLTVKGNDNAPGTQFILGIPDPPDRTAWEFVRSNRNSYAIVKDWLDVTNLIDFMLVWNWGNAEAEYRSAGARTSSPGGSKGFKFWIADADGHLRQQSGVGGVLNLNRTSTTGPGLLFSALLTAGDPDFKTLLADRIYKNFFNGGPMSPEGNTARLNLRMAEITNSMVAECARWGSGAPSGIHSRTPESWQNDAQYARDNLFPFRTMNLFNIVRNAGWYPLIDPPTLNQFGGSVSNGFEMTASASGTIYYTLDGTDPRLPGGGIAPGALSWTSGPMTNQVVNIPLNSTWRYYNTNDAPPGAWKDINYNDSSWPSGAAPLGYGDPGMNTTLVWGPDLNNKWPAYYFRQKFVVTNLAGISNLSLGLRRDDGAVIYLNGVELMRDNMPPGPITYTNYASTAVSGAGETTVYSFTVPANLLVTGTNVIAVEVHQDKGNSTDLVFDFSLQGSVTSDNSLLVVPITGETTFTARVWNGSTWSALAQTTFYLAPIKAPSQGDLVFSEIHYNPPGSDDFEFLEIYNTSTNVLDLTGVRITDGLEFLFPNNYCLGPGAFAIVVEHVGSFNSRYRQTSSPFYHPGINVAGAWTGQLSNEGERLILVASNGTELASVSYGISGTWPSRADGNGSSLELRDPAGMVSTNLFLMNANLNRGANWRSSPLNHGSPGRLDTEPRRIVINELVAHSNLGEDWIELQNVSGSPVDLTGYYLSDTFNQPLRFSLTGVTLEPGEFLVLNATNLGFAFSELGEAALLIQAFGTNVLRFEDTVDFPAVEQEEPFGRYTRSDSLVDFTELRQSTPGAANALPRIGPVVFSEIMYKPATGFAEFVEIVNIAATNVLLYDPLRPTNTWELSDAVDFKFPTGQQLAPGQVAIICDTAPATFRAQYGVDPSIPVYGPWTGALNNAGETLRLRRPGNPETNGVVPYYRVDRVRYEPIAPWPEEAWNGHISLERVTLEGYGNDPINWQASVLGGTPGIFVGNRPPSVTVLEGDTTGLELELIAFTMTGSDLDQPWQSLTLSATNLPSGSSFHSGTGQFTWTPTEAQGPGEYAVQFIVRDNGVIPMVTTQIVTVTVLEANQPPVVNPIGNVVYPALAPFSLTVSASDPDLPAQALAFSASGLPAGLQMHPLTGEISGSAQTPGVYPVTVSVADDQSPPLMATNGFTLTITEPFVVKSSFAGGGTQFSFEAMAGETYEVQFSFGLNPPDWHLLQRIENASGGNHVISPPQGQQCFIRVVWIRSP